MESEAEILARIDPDNLSEPELSALYEAYCMAGMDVRELEFMLLSGYPPREFFEQPSAKGIPPKLCLLMQRALEWRQRQLQQVRTG